MENSSVGWKMIWSSKASRLVSSGLIFFFLFSLCLFTLLFFLFRWLLIWMQGVCICAGNPTRVKMHRCAEVKPLRMLMILDQKPQQQTISVCVSSSKAATRFCHCFAHMEAYVSEVECSSIAQERDISSPNPLFVPSTHNAMQFEKRIPPPSLHLYPGYLIPHDFKCILMTSCFRVQK